MNKELPSRREFLGGFAILALSPLFLRLGSEKPKYTDFIFSHCPYGADNITEMKLEKYQRGWKSFVPKTSIEEVADWLNTWKGRNIWKSDGKGYGYIDAPDDVEMTSKMALKLKRNLVNGHEITDDATEIWFYESESANEAYVLPIISMTTPYCDKNGEHCDVHLCGAYAVSRNLLRELENMFETS